jgi:lysophospholipase L1-like esterase
MRLRNLLAGSLVVGISCLLAILAAEAVARIAFPEWAPRTGRLASFWQHDPVYGWSHRPGQEGRFASWGFDTGVRINSHGFRGPETSFDKPSGTRRIVVLGDSFVWGFGVEEADSFPALLQSALGPGNEVLNLGVSGYSTDQELLVYRNVGRRYQPDVVVLVVASNDFANNVLPVAYVVYGKPVFRRTGGGLELTNQPVPLAPWPERFLFSLASRSFLVNQLNRVREERRLGATMADGNRTPAASPAERPFPASEAEHVTLELINRIREEAEADGARFVLVLVDDIYGGRNFRRALEERGLEALALDDVMAGHPGPLHIEDGLHWNPEGHWWGKARTGRPQRPNRSGTKELLLEELGRRRSRRHRIGRRLPAA